jgi:hypothetical protein
MGDAFTIDFGPDGSARAVVVQEHLRTTPAALGLPGPRPVLVVVGGAGGLTDRDLAALRAVVEGAIRPAVVASGAIVVDGGTDSGVMRLLGRAREGLFPLVGVAAIGTATLPGRPAPRPGAADLEPHHTHFVLVPGTAWGDEAPWLARVATGLAGRSPAATILLNGGAIAYDDVRHSLAERTPVLVLDGTGRTADRIAAARRGARDDDRATALAASDYLSVVPVTEVEAVRVRLEELLAGP